MLMRTFSDGDGSPLPHRSSIPDYAHPALRVLPGNGFGSYCLAAFRLLSRPSAGAVAPGEFIN